MTHPILSRRRLLGAGAAVVSFPRLVNAQAFPSHLITIVLPYAIGGPVDLAARSVQEPLQKLLGQPVIVDAKPGASGMLATRIVARAPADGHTLLIQTPNILITPQLARKPEFAPLQDFEPVSMLVSQPFVLLVHASVPARNMKEFVEYARANPGRLEYGSAGSASFSRLGTELLMAQTGTKMVHVPYKGAGASIKAIYTGEIRVLMTSMSPQIQQFVDDGKLRILGVATPEPSAVAPGAEPIARTVRGFEAVVWMGLFAPKGTPAPVLERLQQAVARMQSAPEYKARAQALAVEVDTSRGDALKARLRREYNAWGDVIRKAGITEE